MEPRGAKSAVHADDSADSNGSHNNREKAKKTPVFVTCYEDWEAFDAAVAHAMTQHHPLRKRSSLTFEVYNRTVSKGRHDRRVIAEFLSKTYKCTHGIKFRARGHGKRLRHKLRDIGCPFHVYASAVEFGETYRVKVRVHDEHNHPIGPNTMTSVEALHRDTEYEFVAPAAEAPLAAPLIGPASLVHSVALPGQQPVQHAQDLLQAQAQALVHAHMQSRMPTRSASTMTEQFLSIPGSHCTEALLEQNTATIGSSSASSSSRPLSSRKRKASLQFEDSATTFEGLRQQLSAFAQERGWDQVRTSSRLIEIIDRPTDLTALVVLLAAESVAGADEKDK